MKFGFVVPWGDATDIGELAVTAEASGWDGIFVWWVPFLVFFTWYLVMFSILRAAVKEQRLSGGAAPATG